jgi:hypothetical protein
MIKFCSENSGAACFHNPTQAQPEPNGDSWQLAKPVEAGILASRTEHMESYLLDFRALYSFTSLIAL